MEASMTSSLLSPLSDCTGSTCMKWTQDGSLSAHDQAALLRRLCAVDPELALTDPCRIALEPPHPDQS